MVFLANVNMLESNDEQLDVVINKMNHERELDSSYPLADNYYVFYDALSDINKKHDYFLNSELADLQTNFDIPLLDADSCYGELLVTFQSSKNQLDNVDKNGKVEEEGSDSITSVGYVPSYSVSDSDNYLNDDNQNGISISTPPVSNFKTTSYESNVKDNNVINNVIPQAIKVSSNHSDKISSSTGVSNSLKNSAKSIVGGMTTGTLAGTAGGVTAGAVAAISDKVNNSSYEPIDYLLGNYTSEGISDDINADLKNNVTEFLGNHGLSEEKANEIVNGEYSVSQVLIDSTSEKLVELYQSNSSIKQGIMNQYGIDVFNDDGTVNNDMLSFVLYMDDLDGKDNYSLINLLSTNYGINMVDSNLLSRYEKTMEALLLTDFGVKEAVINEYGFDIYNYDGSINTDRLTLVMLIDSKRSDGKSLNDIIDIYKDSVSGFDLAINIKKPGNINVSKSDSSVIAPVGVALATAGVTAAAVGGMKALKDGDKLNSDENHSISDMNDDISNDNKNTDNNEWIFKAINN